MLSRHGKECRERHSHHDGSGEWRDAKAEKHSDASRADDAADTVERVEAGHQCTAAGRFHGYCLQVHCNAKGTERSTEHE